MISGHSGPSPGLGMQRDLEVCKLVDTTTCIGCKACEVACAEWNDLPFSPTIGQPGTFQAIVRGAVSEAWAWTFHPAWYKQVTGRDPQQACEEARRQMTTGSKPT